MCARSTQTRLEEHHEDLEEQHEELVAEHAELEQHHEQLETHHQEVEALAIDGGIDVPATPEEEPAGRNQQPNPLAPSTLFPTRLSPVEPKSTELGPGGYRVKTSRPHWTAEQEEVVATMKWAWKGYKEFAWGKDELLPVSKVKFNSPVWLSTSFHGFTVHLFFPADVPRVVWRGPDAD